MNANMTRLALACMTLALVCACDRTTSGTASDASTSTAPTSAAEASATTQASPQPTAESSPDMSLPHPAPQ